MVGGEYLATHDIPSGTPMRSIHLLPVREAMEDGLENFWLFEKVPRRWTSVPETQNL
jgi:hypothetical protein